MLNGLGWLALEVKDLDRAAGFYATHLDLEPVRHTEFERWYTIGDDTLRLRKPGPVPRGGVHTHFAFAAPRTEYQAWYDRLSSSFDLVEFEFGSSKSLYFYDPDGHCVEIGGIDDHGESLTGIFEIVLEVEDLDRAEAFYTALGMSVYDRGTERRRVRLDAGPVDVELWEPQLGIARARGGVHVDIGFDVDDSARMGELVSDRACRVESTSDGVRVRDPDGHYLTFLD